MLPLFVPVRRTLRLRLFAALLPLTLCVGCYRETTIDAYRVVPGSVALPGVTRLTLGEFAGPGADALAQVVAQGLVQRNDYTVHDGKWTRPAAWATESGWSGQPAWGGQREAFRQSVPTGEGEALLMAHVDYHAVDDDYSFDEHRHAQGQPYTVWVRQGVVRVEVQFRALDPEDGAVLGAWNVAAAVPLVPEETAVEGYATGDVAEAATYFAARDVSGAFYEAYRQIAERVSSQVAVKHERIRVKLYVDASDKRWAEAQRSAERGAWHRAEALFAEWAQKADERSENVYLRSRAHLNLGQAYAMQGAYHLAEEELRWAQSLHNDTHVATALQQVRWWQYEASRKHVAF